MCDVCVISAAFIVSITASYFLALYNSVDHRAINEKTD